MTTRLNQRVIPLLVGALVAVAACAGDGLPGGGAGTDPDAAPGGGGDGGGPIIPPGTTFLTAPEHLIRAAMALRGMRPSPEELTAVTEDPTALEGIIDDYLETPEFGATMRELHNEAFFTRDFALPAVSGLSSYSSGRVMRSIGDEPLRLVEHVVMEDRPYTEIVTADYTVADDVVAAAFGLAYDATGPAWQETHYVDGRPHAGVLTSSTMFLRHISAGQNWQRGRANMVSRSLLCDDFLERDIIVDTSIDLSDPAVVRDAVVANPACAGCHQTLDPLASYFWPMDANVNIGRIASYPLDMYDDAKVGRWRGTSGRPPSFYGQAGSTLTDLGGLIAEDPRFSLCASRRFFSYFSEMPLADVPLDVVARFQTVLEESGMSAKELAKAIVLSDEFRIAYAPDDGGANELIGYKKARPEQLGRLIEDLTGFRWLIDSTVAVRGAPLGRVDLLENDVVGYRVLSGGIDSELVLTPSHTTNATSSLVLRGIAAEAAGFTVVSDFAKADPTQRKLLTLVEATDRGEAKIRTQLVALHARLYGTTITSDDPEIDETYAMFADTLTRTIVVAPAQAEKNAAMFGREASSQTSSPSYVPSRPTGTSTVSRSGFGSTE